MKKCCRAGMRERHQSQLSQNKLLDPSARSDKTVDVLIDDPHAHDRIQDIKRLYPGKKIKCLVGLREDILQYVNAVSTNQYGSTTRESVSTILGQLDGPDEDTAETSIEQLINENDSAIVRLVNKVIVDAYNQGASDIHIEPKEAKARPNPLPHGRSLGRIHEVPAAYRRALVARLKIMAELDISERRKPQDGKISSRSATRTIELRVATIPTGRRQRGRGHAHPRRRQPMPLDRLGMTPRNLREFRSLLEKPYGMLLCVGPTGSGKTTTLHSALGSINTPDRKIWTAEDPVEITQKGLRQVQVQSEDRLHLRRGDARVPARRPRRHHGRRDARQGDGGHGIEASLTGHLVFSTLHTNARRRRSRRLLDMGMDPFNFADALLGILAQRLVRTLCQECREAYHPAKEGDHRVAYGYDY